MRFVSLRRIVGHQIHGIGDNQRRKQQGRIHGNTVADGWAGAVMQKPLAIQKHFLPTDQIVELCVRD